MTSLQPSMSVAVQSKTLASVYLSHNLVDRWGTTWRDNQSSPFLSFLCFSHGVVQSQACPLTDVIFPSFSLSAPSSPTLHSALEKCLGKARRSCNVPIPLQLALFHNGQEFFVGSNGLPDSASNLFIRNVFSVWDAKESSEASHLHSLDLSLCFCCQCPCLTSIKEYGHDQGAQLSLGQNPQVGKEAAWSQS